MWTSASTRAGVALGVVALFAGVALAADPSPSPRPRGEGRGEARGEGRGQADPCAEASAAAWKAIEDRGGVVPEIEADDVQAPPAWWHFPSPRRAAEIFAAEARDETTGLYSAVAAPDVEAGDIVVRTAGAGACGRLSVVAGRVEGRWALQDAVGPDGVPRPGDDAFFAGGRTLRPEASAYRIRVKGDSSLAHARELDRDLGHLERTIAERPPRIARGGRIAVEEKLHDLLDEAWSLVADSAFDLPRRELAGRALALAAALDWPGSAESAAAVLDDVLVRAPTHAAPAIARASVFLLAGQPERAARLADVAVGLPGTSPRARYILGRALLAGGKNAEGLGALRSYLAVAPYDVRASRLVATSGREPALEPPPRGDAALVFVATAEHAGATSGAYGFQAAWPVPWRVVAKSVTAENGLLVDLVTERVFDDAGEPARGFTSLLAQRPSAAPERAALVKKAGRTIFPDAKLKSLPPLVPGSRREGFRERGEGGAGPTAGEVTTLERNGVVYFVVLNAPAPAYAKLKDEYAAFVKSLVFTPPPSP
jgi:hypothetical protein